MAQMHFIDAKGLKCPMPVIKLQKMIRQLDSGEQVAIECTDPGAEKDITSWCKVNKHVLLALTTGKANLNGQTVQTLTLSVQKGQPR